MAIVVTNTSSAPSLFASPIARAFGEPASGWAGPATNPPCVFRMTRTALGLLVATTMSGRPSPFMSAAATAAAWAPSGMLAVCVKVPAACE